MSYFVTGHHATGLQPSNQATTPASNTVVLQVGCATAQEPNSSQTALPVVLMGSSTEPGSSSALPTEGTVAWRTQGDLGVPQTEGLGLSVAGTSAGRGVSGLKFPSVSSLSTQPASENALPVFLLPETGETVQRLQVPSNSAVCTQPTVNGTSLQNAQLSTPIGVPVLQQGANLVVAQNNVHNTGSVTPVAAMGTNVQIVELGTSLTATHQPSVSHFAPSVLTVQQCPKQVGVQNVGALTSQLVGTKVETLRLTAERDKSLPTPFVTRSPSPSDTGETVQVSNASLNRRTPQLNAPQLAPSTDVLNIPPSTGSVHLAAAHVLQSPVQLLGNRVAAPTNSSERVLTVQASMSRASSSLPATSAYPVLSQADSDSDDLQIDLSGQEQLISYDPRKPHSDVEERTDMSLHEQRPVAAVPVNAESAEKVDRIPESHGSKELDLILAEVGEAKEPGRRNSARENKPEQLANWASQDGRRSNSKELEIIFAELEEMKKLHKGDRENSETTTGRSNQLGMTALSKLQDDSEAARSGSEGDGKPTVLRFDLQNETFAMVSSPNESKNGDVVEEKNVEERTEDEETGTDDAWETSDEEPETIREEERTEKAGEAAEPRRSGDGELTEAELRFEEMMQKSRIESDQLGKSWNDARENGIDESNHSLEQESEGGEAGSAKMSEETQEGAARKSFSELRKMLEEPGKANAGATDSGDRKSHLKHSLRTILRDEPSKAKPSDPDQNEASPTDVDGESKTETEDESKESVRKSILNAITVVLKREFPYLHTTVLHSLDDLVERPEILAIPRISVLLENIADEFVHQMVSSDMDVATEVEILKLTNDMKNRILPKMIKREESVLMHAEKVLLGILQDRVDKVGSFSLTNTHSDLASLLTVAGVPHAVEEGLCLFESQHLASASGADDLEDDLLRRTMSSMVNNTRRMIAPHLYWAQPPELEGSRFQLRYSLRKVIFQHLGKFVSRLLPSVGHMCDMRRLVELSSKDAFVCWCLEKWTLGRTGVFFQTCREILAELRQASGVPKRTHSTFCSSVIGRQACRSQRDCVWFWFVFGASRTFFHEWSEVIPPSSLSFFHEHVNCDPLHPAPKPTDELFFQEEPFGGALSYLRFWKISLQNTNNFTRKSTLNSAQMQRHLFLFAVGATDHVTKYSGVC